MSNDGDEGDDGSRDPNASADGRYVVFSSRANNLVHLESYYDYHIYLYDRQSGQISLVDRNSEGELADSHGEEPSVSADGRYVAFYSEADNLAGGVWGDIFVVDRQTGTVELISKASDGGNGDAKSLHPIITPDGRYVAFVSSATNLVSEGATQYLWAFYVRDRETDETEMVSLPYDDSSHFNQYAGRISISDDGRFVAFESQDDSLVPDDDNDANDIFVYDRQTGVTTLASVATDGTQANKDCGYPSISPDGRYVAFHSRSRTLVPGDDNGETDVFLRDLQEGVTWLVSRGADGQPANETSYEPTICSAEGVLKVAYTSAATNLVADVDYPPLWNEGVFISTMTKYYLDADGDGYGVDQDYVISGNPPAGYAEQGGDCDDADPEINPELAWYKDADDDGLSDGTTATQCTRPEGYKPASELTATSGDCDDDDPSVTTGPTWYSDADGDGYTDGQTLTQCTRPEGYKLSEELTTLVRDCDDSDAAVHPGAVEIENGRDDDCDGVVDEEVPSDLFRVSVSASGQQANGASYGPSFSYDGKVVGFMSWADNLVVGDTNETSDVFVHGCETGGTERVSISSQGVEGNDRSSSPALSLNGRYVAFQSEADILVADDTDDDTDIFVRDREAGTTKRVSMNSDGTQWSYKDSWNPSISSDGDKVVFETNTESLRWEIFVHQLSTGVTEKVSTAFDGGPANGSSNDPVINYDGTVVAYNSRADNLAYYEGWDANDTEDLYRRNLSQGVNFLVSKTDSGEQINKVVSGRGSISANGQWVAFATYATNMGEGDTEYDSDIFLRDVANNETYRASVSSEGVHGNASSYSPSLSTFGRWVAFESIATNLVPNDTNGVKDIFLHDRLKGRTIRISVAADGSQANGHSSSASLSFFNDSVAFTSEADNLVPNDTNGCNDIFVRHLNGYFRDADGDGIGSENDNLLDLFAPEGYVAERGDCDDSDPAVGQAPTWYRDADEDGYSSGYDVTRCTRPEGYKLADELTAVSGDCDDGDSAINPATVWFRDADGDGYSDGVSATQCARPDGYNLPTELTATSGDCDDSQADLHPGQTWYQDQDGDGYSDGANLVQCSRPEGHALAAELVAIAGDCDDSQAETNPGALEVSNGLDDDCDGVVDESAVGGILAGILTGGDSDGDGMPDSWEQEHFGSLARDGTADFDGDGVCDLDECEAKTDPTERDTDGDGMPDGYELANGLDPLTDDADLDKDGDGYTNKQECDYGSLANDAESTPKPAGVIPLVPLLLRSK